MRIAKSARGPLATLWMSLGLISSHRTRLNRLTQQDVKTPPCAKEGTSSEKQPCHCDQE